MIASRIITWVYLKAILCWVMAIFFCFMLFNIEIFAQNLLKIDDIKRTSDKSSHPIRQKAASLNGPSEQHIEIIVDNDMSNFFTSGPDWKKVVDLSAYGGNYLRVNGLDVSETHQAMWRPDLPVEGEYKVYLKSVNNQGGWHVPFTVYSHDGVFSGVVSGRRASEQTENSRWVYLGTWYFKAGTSGYVALSSYRAGDGDVPWEGGQDGLAYVNADAVRFIFSQKPVIIDNSDKEFTNSEGWEINSHSSQFGNNFLTSLAGNGMHWAIWRPNIEASGYYDVFARWVCNTGNDIDLSMSKNAAFEINYLGEKTTRNVSQRWVRGVWVYLGTYPFASGSGGYVRLVDAPDGKVVADAIKFRKTNIAPSQDKGFVTVAANNTSFIFQNGEAFAPVGYNLRDILFPEATTYYNVSDTEELFARIHAEKVNILRFWMQDISERLWLFQDGQNFNQALPVGSINMWYAQRMHDILYLAEKYDIYLVPVLWDDYFAAKYCWDIDPYNSINEGPLTNRLYFNRFAESDAAKIWQERLFRFLAEEYGSKSHIFAWDIGNDFSGDETWISVMSTYLRSIDINHLISYQYSTGVPWPETMANFVDFTTVRAYPYNAGNNPLEIAKMLSTSIRSQLALGKPVITGEFGPLTNYEPNDLITMANVTLYGLWTSVTSGALSTWKWSAGYAFCPDLNELERQFYSVHASVLQNINMTNGKWIDASADIQVYSNPMVVFNAIKSGKELLAWFMDDSIFQEPKKLTIHIASYLTPSQYVWDWIDPMTGRIVKTEKHNYSQLDESTVEYEKVILLHIYSQHDTVELPFIQLLLND
jgi:hypothetical protein